MPGAAKHIVCPLCKSLAADGPLSKDALRVLNSQPAKEPMRTCPRCAGQFKQLVTREGVVMCQECAVEADDE